MLLLPVTIATAAAAAIINIWLAMRIMRLRFKNEIGHGDGGNPMLMRRMRAQSNFTEYAPMILILCGLVEMARGSETWLQILMAVFVLGRVGHVIGMDSENVGTGRKLGMTTTLITTLALIAAAVVTLYGTMHTG